MWSLPTLYQLLRTVMVDAAESRPGTDPDRCGFTIAVHTARDQVVQATGIVSDDTAHAGAIAHRIPAALLPPRRPRVSTRKVRSPISRYSERRDDGRPDRSRTLTALDIGVLEPPDAQPALPAASRDDRNITPAERRRHRILVPPQEDPTRLRKPRDIAVHFGDITLDTMYRQLSRWADSGPIHKIGTDAVAQRVEQPL